MKHLIIAIFLLLFMVVNVCADQATLAWEPNKEPDLAGYKIYRGLESGVYTDMVDVGNKTTYTVTGLLTDTTYFFVLTAYDLSSNESGYSEEVLHKTSDTISPSNPTGLRTVIKAVSVIIEADKVVVNSKGE